MNLDKLLDGELETIIISEPPAELAASFLVLDDEQKSLSSVLNQVLPRLTPLCTVLPLPFRERTPGATNSPFQVLSSHETLSRFQHAFACLDANFLLINAHIDLHPPGELLYALFSQYGYKAPARFFLFANEDLVRDLARDFSTRGAEAVFELSEKGVVQFIRGLEKLVHPSPVRVHRPTIHYRTGWQLTPEQQDLLRLLFAEEQEVSVTDAEGGGNAGRRLVVETGSHRRYFVKLGRWDNLTAEYANYLELIQGKHENYAGRAIGRPEIRGAQAALRFSLARTDEAPSLPLRKFFQQADLPSGERLLRALKERMVSNLRPSLQVEPLEPLRFLRTLPAFFTVEQVEFLSPPSDTRDSYFPPRADQAMRGQRLREFLEQIQQQLQQGYQPEISLSSLTIQEVRYAPDSQGIIAQLSDTATEDLPRLGYKVNLFLPSTNQVSAHALFSSLKLQRGRSVCVKGVVTETLLTSLARARPLGRLGAVEAWRPENRLYDFLFGKPTSDSRDNWQPSCLTTITDARGGDFTHGDFNLTNILVEQRINESPVPWLIDFEKSSADFYPAADWAKLEVEIAVHLTADLAQQHGSEVKPFVQLEHGLWCPRFIDGEWLAPDRLHAGLMSPFRRVVDLEDIVRRLAVESGLTSQRFVDYLFAVFCYSLGALRYAKTEIGKIRAYVKAAVAAKRIEQILSESASL